jgi:SWI/SNF-related matrix-associated actin-dependent regulator 1 of chromatin subfamily A
MNQLTYSEKHKLFAWKGFTPEALILAKEAGFWFHPRGAWVTESKYAALNLIDYADEKALKILLPLEDTVDASRFISTDFEVPAPSGCVYRDFQKAGIWYGSQFDNVLIADQMGLGKTVQALGLANLERLLKTLIICPAALRHNWVTEYKKWSVGLKQLQVVQHGSQILNNDLSVVISYNLATDYLNQLMNIQFDAIICDEIQYLKNGTADRTQTVLGNGEHLGLISRARKRIFLSGTPIKNRANDFYYLLVRLKPELIDGKSFRGYVQRWCTFEETGYGLQITGTKNETDLNNRLRSGFMVRRTKEAVLPELPPKQYNLVVFPAESKKIKAILKKEKPFSPDEIYKNGIPVGSPIPEIRHELGREMVPQTVSFVADMLDGGVEKILLFGYHRDVLAMVSEQFSKLQIGYVLIRGGDSDRKREAAVSSFQNDQNTHVYVANMEAGGIGLNLTAASEVVLVEPSWVPSDNEQCIDRAHRIGQLNKINVHYLVVEGSIGAIILGRSLEKQIDADNILN